MNKSCSLALECIMADRLNGYRILILETREDAQFSRLLTEQGAEVLQCPMFTIHDAPDPAPIEAWIRRSIEKPFDDLVLLTGEGLRRLMKVVRRIGVEQVREEVLLGPEPHVADLGSGQDRAPDVDRMDCGQSVRDLRRSASTG